VSAGKPSGAGESWDGYTKSGPVPSEAGKQVDPALRPLWPPGTFDAATKRAPGGVM
jgi:hypothetical protein